VRIKCPHGWRSVGKLGEITIVNETVEILEGICDRPDRCGISSCEYYDTSREATRRFREALNVTQTLEGWRGDYENDPRHLVPGFRLENLEEPWDEELEQELIEELEQEREHRRRTDEEVAAWLAGMEADGRIERIGEWEDGRPRYRLVPEHWQPQDESDPAPGP
jgi:hypothetical protein